MDEGAAPTDEGHDMDSWTALTLSRVTTCELRREADRHRMAKLALAACRPRRPRH